MKLNLKNSIFLITYSVLIIFALLKFQFIINLFYRLILVLMPFIYGFIIAYIINWPYEFFKTKVLDPKINPNKDKNKLTKNISMVISYALIFGILAFLLITIIPQIIVNLNQFIDNFSRYSNSFLSWSRKLESKFKLNLISADYSDAILKNLSGFIDRFADILFPKVYNFTRTFALGIYNWIIGIIISIYLIGNKNKLLKQLKMLVSAYIPEKISKEVLKILLLSHITFGKFLIGKVFDSIIIGVLCFIGMSILKIPYTLLISTVIGITNIIPFFGPFIGAIPCIFILLIVDHVKALWFMIFILILQQIDGNIIGPKVLGNTVGISGMWIMFSVIIGGSLFGIPGMILGVPIFTVIYTLLSENIKKSCTKDII